MNNLDIENMSLSNKFNLLQSNCCGIEQLDILSNDVNCWIRSFVASHKKCSVEILEKLSNDKEYVVRNNVSKNINSTKEVLEKLYKEFPNEVLQHPNCPDYLKIFLR